MWYILRRLQNFVKSLWYIWPLLHRTNPWWRFRKHLWPSHNVWTLTYWAFIRLLFRAFSWKQQGKLGEKTLNTWQNKKGQTVFVKLIKWQFFFQHAAEKNYFHFTSITRNVRSFLFSHDFMQVIVGIIILLIFLKIK